MAHVHRCGSKSKPVKVQTKLVIAQKTGGKRKHASNDDDNTNAYGARKTTLCVEKRPARATPGGTSESANLGNGNLGKRGEYKYSVNIMDTTVRKCGIVLDKVVLKSSAYLSVPTDLVQDARLQDLLKEKCSAKKLNHFSKKMEYTPYYRRVRVKKRWMYKVPLLFWYMEGIEAKVVKDFRKVPSTMPNHMKIKPDFKMRDHQEAVHPVAMAQMTHFPNFATTICQHCGAGKTIQASAIIGTLRVRTFIGVPTLELADQFKKEVRVVMDIPEDQIQLVGSDFPDPVVGKWIYICVFNSAMTTDSHTTKYANIIRSCDMIIVDECHKFPAPCVKSILVHFQGKYRLGLTATPVRSDGLSEMIFKMLGPQCVYVEREKPPLGMWKFFRLDYYNPDHKGDILVKKRYKKEYERDAIAMMQRVCEDKVRTKAIAQALVAKVDRDALVLGDWKNILNDMVQEIEDVKAGSTYLFVGGGSKSKKARAEKEAAFRDRAYILATTSKAACGLNVPRINDVVFVTPRVPGVLLEQGSGRGLRKWGEKRVFYVNDVATPYYASKARRCEAWFKKSGYQIMPPERIGPHAIPGSITAHMTHMKRKDAESEQSANMVYKRRRK